MATVRVLVTDVDAAVAAYESVGYTLHQRWGPPFAILRGHGAELWVSGPETSAAEATALLPPSDAAGAAVRLVHECAELAPEVTGLLLACWESAAGPVTGPGGSQQLLRRGPVLLEVFAPR